MAKESASILLSILIIGAVFWGNAQAATIMTTQKRIVLDPGHGGKETGIVTPSGVQEQQVALELAQMIASNLSAAFQVHLTRQASGQAHPPTREQRTASANQARADLFVGIHLQQTRDGAPLVFYLDSPGQTAAAQSRRMARITARQLSFPQHAQAGILKGGFIPLEDLLMPAILVEPISISGLPDTPADRKPILSPYARALAASIREFFSNKP